MTSSMAACTMRCHLRALFEQSSVEPSEQLASGLCSGSRRIVVVLLFRFFSGLSFPIFSLPPARSLFLQTESKASLRSAKARPHMISDILVRIGLWNKVAFSHRKSGELGIGGDASSSLHGSCAQL